jgi:hypothetical protein
VCGPETHHPGAIPQQHGGAGDADGVAQRRERRPVDVREALGARQGGAERGEMAKG